MTLLFLICFILLCFMWVGSIEDSIEAVLEKPRRYYIVLIMLTACLVTDACCTYTAFYEKQFSFQLIVNSKTLLEAK